MRADDARDREAAPEDGVEVMAAAIGLLELLARGAGEADVRRGIAHVANIFAPQEVWQVYQVLREHAAPEALARVAPLAPLWAYYLDRKPAVFQRELLTPGGILYRSAVEGAERGGLVALTAGPTHDLFMSNCRFLDSLGHLPIDILILTNREGRFGRWNMGGSGSQYVALQRLKGLLAEKGVRPRCYLGASAGGAPALAAASMDAGCCGITLAGRLHIPGRSERLRHPPMAFLPICACRPATPNLHAIFNADDPIDAQDARILRAMAPLTRLYPIPNAAVHSPMPPLMARGKLRAVFAQIGEAALGRVPDFDMITTL